MIGESGIEKISIKRWGRPLQVSIIKRGGQHEVLRNCYKSGGV